MRLIYQWGVVTTSDILPRHRGTSSWGGYVIPLRFGPAECDVFAAEFCCLSQIPSDICKKEETEKIKLHFLFRQRTLKAAVAVKCERVGRMRHYGRRPLMSKEIIVGGSRKVRRQGFPLISPS